MTSKVLAAALASALFLCACGSDDDPPSLSEIKDFRAYPVYWSGTSVAGNDLIEVTGDPTLHEDERKTVWVLIYGRCKDPPDEGGCPPPLQIHSYSTCFRWATRGPTDRPQVFDFRGAKASRPFPGGGAGLEIFTGRTTITLHAESQAVLDAATDALRTVHQKRPGPLPPPVPGSLTGELPCQSWDE